MDVIKPKSPLVDVQKIKPELRQVLQDIQTDGTLIMAKYPPQTLTKSGYVRTDTLKRSWMQAKPVKETGNTLEAEVGSNSHEAPYNRYVVGKADEQVPMFRRAGWQSVDDLIDFAEKRLERDVRAVIKGAI